MPRFVTRFWIPALLVLLAVGAAATFVLSAQSDSAPSATDSAQLHLGRNDSLPPIERVAVAAPPTATAAPSPTLTIPFTAAPASVPVPTTAAPTIQPATPTPTAPPTAAPAGAFPVRIEIPNAQISAPVLQTSLDATGAIYVPLYAAGHYINSARPGEKGNTVIVGHVRQGLVFNHLGDVKLGDTITLVTERGERFSYTAAEVSLLPAANATPDQIARALRYISPTTDERLTLMTCWPETTYANRLVVVALPQR